MRTTLAGLALVALCGAAVAGDGAAPDRPACGGAKEARCGADLQGTYLAKSLEARSAADRYALGLWCRENTLLPEARAQFREAVRLDPDHAAARGELGERRVGDRWMPSDEAMAAKGLVRHDGRWILPEEKAILTAPASERVRLQREEDRARALIETMAAGGEREARMAREALASVDARARVAPLAFALRARERKVRVFAAGELGALKDRRALRPLVHRALRDPDSEVRAACVDAAKDFGDPELLAPFARALLQVESPEVRAAAAEGIGRLGDLRGVQYLVYAIEGHGGGPRAHIYAANQLTFVQDFDVEVAQTAFIADPIVGVLQEGVALDVQVLSNEWYGTRVERRAIVGALRTLSGTSHGDDPAAWRKWMAENRARVFAVAER